MSLRYKLGPVIDFAVQRPAPVDESRDVVPTLESVGLETGAVLQFPAFDPGTQVAPVEARAYFVAPGDEIPADADAYVASPIPYSFDPLDVQPTGCVHHLPIPTELQDGSYLVQVVLGYPAS